MSRSDAALVEVDDQRMIEQGPAAVGRGLHVLKHLGEHSRIELVDLGVEGMVVRLMRQRMVAGPAGEAWNDLRESQRRVSVSERKGRHASEVALKRSQDDRELIARGDLVLSLVDRDVTRWDRCRHLVRRLAHLTLRSTATGGLGKKPGFQLGNTAEM